MLNTSTSFKVIILLLHHDTTSHHKTATYMYIGFHIIILFHSNIIYYSSDPARRTHIYKHLKVQTRGLQWKVKISSTQYNIVVCNKSVFYNSLIYNRLSFSVSFNYTKI